MVFATGGAHLFSVLVNSGASVLRQGAYRTNMQMYGSTSLIIALCVFVFVIKLVLNFLFVTRCFSSVLSATDWLMVEWLLVRLVSP